MKEMSASRASLSLLDASSLSRGEERLPSESSSNSGGGGGGSSGRGLIYKSYDSLDVSI